MSHYEVIIIGAGAGGGVAAQVLAEAGKRVLLLERGRHLSYQDLGRDHLRNHRHFPYGQNAGPDMDGQPRTIATPDGGYRVTRPNEGAYQNNAATVGGGTRVFGAQAWRFMPQDFRMASLYGVPDGSSLADWPITYEDLAPYYERVEWEIGVCGDSDEMSHLPAYARPYPMPPLPMTERGRINRRGAQALGWPVVTPPMLINSVPFGGRAACVHCQHCVGFPCPTDAKNSTYSTAIPRAVATGHCALVPGVMVERITTDATGHATGVAYFDSQFRRVEVSAEVIVVAGGASETARLLLNSASDTAPGGLGNAHDQVGRHLQGHVYPRAVGLFEHPVWDGVGPGVRTATCQFNHGNDGIIGGAMLADDFVTLPIVVWNSLLPPDVPRWGLENKRFMRDAYRRLNDITGPVQEIPTPDLRVTLNRAVRDQWGIPVAHFSGAIHPETRRAADFMLARAKEWLQAAGAVRVWGFPGGQPSGQHHAGTCRMGDDPHTSVVDRWCRVHGHDNLFVADASVHVTNGGFNPVLTIMALAYRTAHHIAQTW
jgi:choline dehydrogenase-like flavoprotein